MSCNREIQLLKKTKNFTVFSQAHKIQKLKTKVDALRATMNNGIVHRLFCYIQHMVVLQASCRKRVHSQILVHGYHIVQ